MNGLVDEMAIFNTELSATEVSELFNGGMALDARDHSESGKLLGYWRNNGTDSWVDLSTTVAWFDEGINETGIAYWYNFDNGEVDIVSTGGKLKLEIVNEDTPPLSGASNNELIICGYDILGYGTTDGQWRNYDVGDKIDLNWVKEFSNNGGNEGVVISYNSSGGTTYLSLNDNNVSYAGNATRFEATIDSINYYSNNTLKDITFSEVRATYKRNTGNDGTVTSAGTELIDDGVFTQADGAYSGSDWIAGSDAALTIESNQLKVTENGDPANSFANAHQGFTVVAGATYTVTGTLVSKSGSAGIKIDRTTTSSDVALMLTTEASASPVTNTFVASTTGTYYVCLTVGTADGNAVFDNVSVKQTKPVVVQLQEVPYFKKDSLGLPMNRVRQKGLNFDQASWADTDATDLFGDGLSDFTVSSWVKYGFNDYNSSWNVIMSNGNASANSDPSGFNLLANDDGFAFRASDGSGQVTDYTSATILEDTWYCLTVTRKTVGSNHEYRIYINESEDADTSTATLVDVSTSSPMMVGKDSTPNRYYKNIIDEPKVYNRALSLAEVSKNYKKALSKHKDNTVSNWSDDFTDDFI